MEAGSRPRLALSSLAGRGGAGYCPDIRSHQVSFVSARLDREGLILNTSTSTSHQCLADPRLGSAAGEKPRLAYGRLRAGGRVGEWGLGGAGQGAVARSVGMETASGAEATYTIAAIAAIAERRSAHGNTGTASARASVCGGRGTRGRGMETAFGKSQNGEWGASCGEYMTGVESGSLGESMSKGQKAHQRNQTVDQSALQQSKHRSKRIKRSSNQARARTRFKREPDAKAQARTGGQIKDPSANQWLTRDENASKPIARREAGGCTGCGASVDEQDVHRNEPECKQGSMDEGANKVSAGIAPLLHPLIFLDYVDVPELRSAKIRDNVSTRARTQGPYASRRARNSPDSAGFTRQPPM
ncbi:hypothetical protein B0H17DRAFT_1125551 [Mycena rosella]|uniref:Uncharacterized protein n=1 Tax=Mycena rosella TaxID=1033263 RepID=A0AAD7GWG5_MYCRO|nr:hypothetical protein B0H17DRAFT_1125551 [Mycena rosella]